jgi:hypothetical protein
MAKIKADMGKPIRDAVTNTTIPEAFIAALAANESSGDPAKKHFESGAFLDLALVLAGRKPAFGSLGAQDLSGVLVKSGISANPLSAVTNKLMDLATSWGPTQIMGYQTLKLHLQVSDLIELPRHFVVCTQLLAEFIAEWKLVVRPISTITVCEKLFRCWNTGEPNGITTDPNYVGKGLNRMAIYEALQ